MSLQTFCFQSKVNIACQYVSVYEELRPRLFPANIFCSKLREEWERQHNLLVTGVGSKKMTCISEVVVKRGDH